MHVYMQAVKETGNRFRETVLALGGGRPPLKVKMYLDMRVKYSIHRLPMSMSFLIHVITKSYPKLISYLTHKNTYASVLSDT